MAAPRKIDYERLEPAWRAGIKSPPQLASDYTEKTGVSVSHTAIIKHFRKLGIPRDLSAKIQSKADAMVLRGMVAGKVAAVTKEREAEIVNDGAAQIATVRISHRADIGRSRALTMALLIELESQTGNLPDLVALGEILRSPNEVGADKLNDIYQAVLSLPERTKTVKALSEALKNLVGLEREAYNIGGNDTGADRKPLTINDFYGEDVA